MRVIHHDQVCPGGRAWVAFLPQKEVRQDLRYNGSIRILVQTIAGRVYYPPHNKYKRSDARKGLARARARNRDAVQRYYVLVYLLAVFCIVYTSAATHE